MASDAADQSNILSPRDETDCSAASPFRDESISSPSLSSSANDGPYPDSWNFFANDGDLWDPVAGTEGLENLKDIAHDAALATIRELSQSTIMDCQLHDSCRSMKTSTGKTRIPSSPDTSQDSTSSLFPSPKNTFSNGTLGTYNGIRSTSGVDMMDDGSSKAGCAWIAASLMQSLESPGASLDNESATQERLRRDLDTVISTNKAVLETVRQISGCRCSVPSNHLVMISAVLFMVLGWYEACLTSCAHAHEHDAITTGSRDPGMSAMTHYDADFFDVGAGTVKWNDTLAEETDDYTQQPVCIPPIQVGNLQLGMESQRQVVAQIVMTEIGHVTTVIDDLIGGPMGMSSFMPSVVSGYQELETQLPFSLRGALQTRIEKIAQAAERAFR